MGHGCCQTPFFTTFSRTISVPWTALPASRNRDDSWRSGVRLRVKENHAGRGADWRVLAGEGETAGLPVDAVRSDRVAALV